MYDVGAQGDQVVQDQDDHENQIVQVKIRIIDQ